MTSFSFQFSLVRIPQCHMNLTPMPFGLASSSQAQPFAHTTCARTVSECSVFGMLMVNATISFNLRGWGQQINAPNMLRFFVSPWMVPSGVTADTGHFTSALGYVRLSPYIILLSPSSPTLVWSQWIFENRNNFKNMLYFQSFRSTKKQNTCQIIKIKAKNDPRAMNSW